MGSAVAEKFDRDGIPIHRPKIRSRGHYALAAPYYLELGYKPIPVKGKVLLVKGATGYGGVVTAEKVHQWCSEYPNADIALRAEGWLGVDIDDHGGKRGWEQLAELEDRFGPLPSTYSCTSRGRFSNSRIYLYRINEDLPRRSTAAKHIDVIHKFHRYLVTFPSTHPQTGERYEWFGPGGELISSEGPPTPLELPVLPPSWDDYLKRGETLASQVNPTRKPFTGRLEDWEKSLDGGTPTAAVEALKREISRSLHIGHNELLGFVGDIEELSNSEKSRGLAQALHGLKVKYFAETNDPNPEKEWENILRWFIPEDWQEKRTSWRSFLAWVGQLASRNGGPNAQQ